MEINWDSTNQEVFLGRKEELIKLANELFEKNRIDEESLVRLMSILNSYSFENRIRMKGMLTYTLVDSLSLDYSLAEKCMMFDKGIK